MRKAIATPTHDRGTYPCHDRLGRAQRACEERRVGTLVRPRERPSRECGAEPHLNLDILASNGHSGK